MINTVGISLVITLGLNAVANCYQIPIDFSLILPLQKKLLIGQ